MNFLNEEKIFVVGDQNGLRFFFLLLFFLFLPLPSLASVSITEIMYDREGSDAKHEWVEVYNDGEPVDVSTWKLFEGDSNHKLTISSGNETIPTGGYAILADNPSVFLTDYPTFSGTVFDVALSGGLNNTNGETLTLRDETLTDRDTVTYSPDWGAAGDGNSLQKVSGSWEARLPTPAAPAGAAAAQPKPKAPAPDPKPVSQSAAHTPQTPTATEEATSDPEPIPTEPITQHARVSVSKEKTTEAPSTKDVSSKQATNSEMSDTNGLSSGDSNENETELDTKELAASPALSDSPEGVGIWIWFAGLGAIVLLGIGGIFFARKKPTGS